MRHAILLDKKIAKADYDKWQQEDIVFWEKHWGITPTYEVIRKDFSDYPTYIDSDGDIRPTQAYLQDITDDVVMKYGQFGVDFIMVMIHEDNWKSDTETTKGIWGTNYSYVFGRQCLEYCRWDKDNPANTFGTAYHERHHSFDAIIKQEIGVNINPILGVTAYDAHITHGGQKPWKYIRHKENTDSLKIMKPYMLTALQKRKEQHETVVKGLMNQVINLAQTLLYLLRASQNKKNGVGKI